MTSRPSRFMVVGPRVFELMKTAPARIRRSFYALLQELEVGPYPDQRPNVAVARGVSRNHCYVAWKDQVEVMYLVMQDQPVISLVGAHWRGGPDDHDGDDDEPQDDDWTWSLAA